MKDALATEPQRPARAKKKLKTFRSEIGDDDLCDVSRDRSFREFGRNFPDVEVLSASRDDVAFVDQKQLRNKKKIFQIGPVSCRWQYWSGTIAYCVS